MERSRGTRDIHCSGGKETRPAAIRDAQRLEMEAVRRMGVDLERHAAVTKERIFAAFPPKATAPEGASTPAPAIAGRDCRSCRQAVRRGVEPSRDSGPAPERATADRGASTSGG